MRKILALTLFGTLAAGAALAVPPTVPELLPLVPQGAQVVVAVDAAALRTHPLVQGWLLDHADWSNADAEAARFLTEAGLDPLRDVTAMVVALAPSDSHGDPVVFIAGRFDAPALAAALTKRGATPVTLGTVSGLRLPEKGRPGAAAVLAQPSPELIVVGSEALVLESLSAGRAGSALVASAISAGQVDPGAPFWAVAAIPAGARQKAADAASKIQGDSEETLRQAVMASGVVQKVAVQASLDDSLRLSGVAVADTAENAELLRDTVKGVLAAARLHCQDRAPELVGVLRDVQVRAAGSQVTLAGAVPVALIEKLIAEHKANRPCDTASHS